MLLQFTVYTWQVYRTQIKPINPSPKMFVFFNGELSQFINLCPGNCSLEFTHHCIQFSYWLLMNKGAIDQCPSSPRFNQSLQKLFTGKGGKDKNQANGNAAASSEMEDGNRACYGADDPSLPILSTAAGKADQTGCSTHQGFSKTYSLLIFPKMD